jgi:LmbE family N-acetylglucosaminyl deacetylase
LERENRRVLALMPHPDDCEILCAGTLIRLRALGWEVHVATMTPGDMGSPSLPREEIAAIRRVEARRGAETLGAASYTCLEFADVEIVFDNPSRHRVAAMLRKVDPILVFTTPPNDYMFDHVITSMLVRDASFNGPMPNYATPDGEQTTSGVPWLYYTDPVEGHDIAGNRAPVSCIVDISDVIEQKVEALACHASQREWLKKQHGMDDYIETMKRWSAQRGQEIGVAYAEGFCQHLGHPHPTDDLLAQLLGAAPFRPQSSGQ